MKGSLSACAIRDKSQNIHNFINRRCNGIKVAPPNEITVPGLRTYTHIQVTGQIITRTIMPQLADDPVSDASGKKRPAKDLSHVATELSHVATELSLCSHGAEFVGHRVFWLSHVATELSHVATDL
jgi:hypothetical protein